VIAGLAGDLPIDQGIKVVLPFLQAPDEGLPPACVTAALYQAFGMSAEATAAGILAASALAPGCPDAVLGAADAASEDPRRPGLGVSASGDDESEDAARLEFQRRNVDLGPSIDPKFLNTVLERVPGAALKQLQDIGKHQRWDALLVGDARALGDAITAAWGSGKYGRLSQDGRDALAAVKGVSEFRVGRLAGILESTPAGQRGSAVWRYSQDLCGGFIVASADRAASADPKLLARAADLEAAYQEGGESPLGARVDRLMAVLAASRRSLSKEDGRRAEEQLKASCTDWTKVRYPLEAVQDAGALVRRAQRRMGQAGWLISDSELDEVQRILHGDAPGRRSQAWETYGKLLGEWIRTQRALQTPDSSILQGLESEAETMAPQESLSL